MFACFLAALSAASAFGADVIRVNVSNTTVTISENPPAGDIVSAGNAGVPATGNSILFTNTGSTANNIIGEVEMPGSGFDNIRMNGTLWKYSGAAALIGTSATTLNITSGTFILTGAISAANVAPGAAGVTIGSGATLKIGDNTATGSLVSGTEGAFGIVNNGVLWLARTGNYSFDNNVSGAGRIESNVTSGTARLTGINTHTGGVMVNAGNLYIEESTALGSGTVQILNAATLWVSPTISRNVTVNNPVSTVGTGRIVVNMATGTDVFAFGPNAGANSNYIGTFILQVGSIYLSGDTDRALANASDFRFDRGSTVYVGTGTHNYKKIGTSASGAAAGTPIVLSFDADFSNPAGPSPARINIDTFGVAASTEMQINVRPVGNIVAPNYTVSLSGTNLLTMDDTAVNILSSTQLVAMNAGKSIAAGDLPRIASLAFDFGAMDAAAKQVSFTQSGTTVADIIYNYYTMAATSGIYLNYGLSALRIQNGKTLTLSGDVAGNGQDEMRLRITGSGNLDVQATRAITLSNRSSDFSGTTTIKSGTLIVSGSLGANSTTVVKQGTVLQLGNGLTSVGNAGGRIENSGSLVFKFVTSGSVNVASNISGTSGLYLDNTAGRIRLSGSNTFSGGVIFDAKGVTTQHDIEGPEALGSGTLQMRNTSAGQGTLWVLPTTSRDMYFNVPVTMTGVSRIVFRMNDYDSTMAFGPAFAASGTGQFIFQRGTYDFGVGATAGLANSTIRIDGGTTVKLGINTYAYNNTFNFSNTDILNNSNSFGNATLAFSADFTNPNNPQTSHLILKAHKFDVAFYVNVTSITPVTVPTYTLNPSGTNLLTMDDDAANTLFSSTMLSFTAGRSMSATDLSRLMLRTQLYDDQGNAVTTGMKTAGYSQNGSVVGDLQYDYNVRSDSNGIYLEYGLAGINVLAGKTLVLSGDTDDVSASEMRLRISGSGNLDVNATGTITVSNINNDFTGATNISQGTLLLTGKLVGSTTINPGTTLQIGNQTATGEAGTDIVNNGTLLFKRTGLAVVQSNISGTSGIDLNLAGTVHFSGTNTFTGGLTLSSNNHEIENGYSLGSGKVNILAGITLWVKPLESHDAFFNNEVITSSTTSRIVVRMKEMTDKFSFGDSIGENFTGIFIAQNGTYDFSGDTIKALANTDQVRIDHGATVHIGQGSQTIGYLNISNATGASSSDPVPKFTFDVMFSDTGAPAVLSNLIITRRLNIGESTIFQLNTSGTIPKPAIDIPASGTSVLALDNTVSFASRLIETTPEATISGIANYLSRITLADHEGNRISASTVNDIEQGGEKVATASYNYFVGQKSDGLYLNYGLAEIHLESGKTLNITGDSATDNVITAKFSGSGNIDINPANMIRIGSYYGTSDFSGTMTLHSGTLGFSTLGGLSPNSTLVLNENTAIDLCNTDQSIGTVAVPRSVPINLNRGSLTVARSGKFEGEIFGTGVMAVGAAATVDIYNNNSNLAAVWVVGTSGTLNLYAPDALGYSTGTMSANTSRINLVNIPGGDFRGLITGAGVFAVTSSTVGLNDSIRSRVIEVKDSTITARHPNAIYAAETTTFENSTLRLDTSSHIRAVNLTLNNTDVFFVPQSDGSHGHLMVSSLRNSGTTNIAMNADLTGFGNADSIIVSDLVEGAYILDITNRAPDNKARKEVAVRVVHAANDADLAKFTLKNGVVEGGMYSYTLVKGDAETGGLVMPDPLSYYLAVNGVNPLSRAAQAVLSTASVAGAEWHYSLDSVSKRMGELRYEVDGSTQERFHNIWSRGGAYKLNARQGISTAAFDEDVYNLSFGADMGRRLSGNNAIFGGVFAGLGYTDRTFDNRSDGRSNSLSAGMYVTWLNASGWMADVVLKTDINKNKFNALAVDGYSTHGAYTSEGVGISGELARKIKLGKYWWVEPGVQAAVVNFARESYTTDNGIKVVLDRSSSAQYRGQLRIGYEDLKSARIQPYGKIAYAYCDSSGGKITADGDTLPRAVDFDDKRLEFGLGASYLVTKQDQLYLEYEYAKANNYRRPWSLNVGFRHCW